MQLRSEASQRDSQLSLRDGLVRQLGALANGVVLSASVAERALLNELQAVDTTLALCDHVHPFSERSDRFAQLMLALLAEISCSSPSVQAVEKALVYAGKRLELALAELESARQQLLEVRIEADEAHRVAAARAITEDVLLTVALHELRHTERDAESARRAVQRVCSAVDTT